MASIMSAEPQTQCKYTGHLCGLCINAAYTICWVLPDIMTTLAMS